MLEELYFFDGVESETHCTFKAAAIPYAKRKPAPLELVGN